MAKSKAIERQSRLDHIAGSTLALQRIQDASPSQWQRPSTGDSAELLRTKGELHLLERLPASVETAERCFHRALDVVRGQGALAWELRAAMSLARLWRSQRRASQARKLLAPVYRPFTEGFGTGDLIAAKALLASVR